MSEDDHDVFARPVWADSSHFDETFLMWRVKPALGLLLVRREPGEEPRLIFCDLSNGGLERFHGGSDHPEASMTFAEARAALDLLEATWKGADGQPTPA